ncbi:MAG: Lrp/AsnC family transcriptional regulator [Nanoarchaeota archaeon]|nr:Lrp/AsnC family transcriptional regulator [Nanoarchaeota archaeon]
MAKRVEDELLEELKKDARKSYRDIAKALGLAVGTISKKVKELEKSGIIKGYVPILDLDKLGFTLTTIVGIKIKKGRSDPLARKLSGNSNVLAIYEVTGGFDLIIIAKFKNKTALNHFLKILNFAEEVERTETFISLNNCKENYLTK